MNNLSNDNPTENEAANLTYDLATGHHVTLSGSMLLNEAIADSDSLPEGYETLLLSLMQKGGDDHDDLDLQDWQAYQHTHSVIPSQNLDTNVMYDPVSGEGLVCVNGRCISNKRKFQVHDEKHIGLKSGNRRREGGQP